MHLEILYLARTRALIKSIRNTINCLPMNAIMSHHNPKDYLTFIYECLYIHSVPCGASAIPRPTFFANDHRIL